MKTTRKLFCAAAFIVLSGCTPAPDASSYLGLGAQYDVVIERDNYGVPHIKGVRDVDAAFGLAYAQAEDHWQLIEDAVLVYRGQSAKYKGPDAAVTDFLVKWLGIWEDIDVRYESDLKPDTRRYLQAFANGLNYYAAKHPDVYSL